MPKARVPRGPRRSECTGVSALQRRTDAVSAAHPGVRDLHHLPGPEATSGFIRGPAAVACAIPGPGGVPAQPCVVDLDPIAQAGAGHAGVAGLAGVAVVLAEAQDLGEVDHALPAGAAVG